MAIEHSNIDYSERIANNVGLAGNRRLKRALESWQPNYMKWWRELGPDGSTKFDVYLRTAISVEADGWANFGFVKMPELTLQRPIPVVLAGGASPTLTLSARNAFKWTRMEVFDPEMAGQNGSADDVRTIRDNVPPPATFSASVRIIF